MSKTRRRIIRSCLDFVALLSFYLAMRMAGSSDGYALLLTAMVAIYGLACFWDGLIAGEKTISQGDA